MVQSLRQGSARTAQDGVDIAAVAHWFRCGGARRGHQWRHSIRIVGGGVHIISISIVEKGVIVVGMANRGGVCRVARTTDGIGIIGNIIIIIIVVAVVVMVQNDFSFFSRFSSVVVVNVIVPVHGVEYVASFSFLKNNKPIQRTAADATAAIQCLFLLLRSLALALSLSLSRSLGVLRAPRCSGPFGLPLQV